MLATITVERGPQTGSSFDVRPGAPFLVGSAAGVQARLDGVAPRHLALMLDASGLKVVDLVGGATLDDAPLAHRQPTPVGSGQGIAFGPALLRVELDGVPEPLRAPPAPAREPPIAGFEVLAVLGQGGMGRVLHARRLADGREVAVKVLHEAVVPGSPDHRRFAIEGRVGARVRSPYVVEVLDAGVDAHGRALIVLELVRGPSLQAHLRQAGPLAVPVALRVGEHVALALAAAHAAGVLHRDVKPANVLLAPDGTAKLTDFGVAKDLAGTAHSLTRSGVGLGTIAYMAPEQIDAARSVGPAADLYGLGATLYHALAGRPPREVKTFEDIRRVLETPPAPLRGLRPDCPPGVEALVHALLEVEAADRPPSAAEVARRLRAMA